MGIATVNPATGETLQSFRPATDAAVEATIGRAYDGWKSYRVTDFAQRSAWMRASSDLLAVDSADVARLMTTEMGKTLKAARAEVDKCIRALNYFAEQAEQLLADEPVEAKSVGAVRAYARYEAMGPTLAVMPWNFPLWQVIRFAAPALMAANVVLLKHASNVPQTALYLEDLFRRGGFPDGCFQTLLITSGQVESVLRDPRIAAATLTGSELAGRSVAAICGDEVKRTVLELGGSDPFVVMPSADLDRAVEAAVTSRIQNNGQTCIAAKRFIVHTDVYDAFTDAFVSRMRALRVGDPLDSHTQVGPLATEQGRVEIDELVTDAVERGAQLLCGGRVPDGPGWFYPPTVVAGITPEMRMYSEEAFGPVASVYRVSNIDEAIEIANATPFGLGSNAWTTAASEQKRFTRDLEAGQVFINGMTGSYNELPFGGTKRSGYGRELSAHGIREFCNLKTIWVGA
ncbi:NADP-dependent succinic semialdehyde dehydrogenase (plasmid) [Mycobacterium dioxanotrophicus]|uniref:NADP-dependent succinic semialdehyde dehydrogenase n=1 Tax=Mycobacterium dioxanotrophicus TaxID=482462 RepID=A0A1Y0CH00_9MYCO|nr:NADP-dependent succinic semialdehyde dehydrogenase [Mycobacterium dioxanotrophicus]ART74287.1 NADP-dependent succinic semialdehyde dehydrogenase [Mycobacterium dioxanotrophicus]